MEYGHPVAPSHGHQQMVRPHAPLYDEEPITEPRLHAVVADEDEHHEKKPVLKKVKDKVKKIKDTITKKSHGHGDDHDDEHYVEGEGYDEEDEEMVVEPEVDDAPHGLDGQHKPFTLDRRDEYIDVSALEAPGSLGNRGSLSGRDEHELHDPLSSRDDRPGTLTSRNEHVPLGGLQEPPVTPATMKDTTLEADLPYGSVPPTDSINISGSKTAGPTPGNEFSVSPDVLSSLEAMAISVQRESQQKDQQGSNVGHEASNVEKKPSYTEKLSSTAAAAKDAAVSAASTVYAKVAGSTSSGGIANPARTGPGVEGEPREGAGEKKGSYTEKLSSTAAAAKDAVVHAASTVYGKVAGDTYSGEKHDQVATPVSTGPGVEAVARGGAGEKKGTYTEKLSGTALAAKDAAVNAASTVYGKVTGAGSAVTEQDKGVSVREFLAEKLRPGEEDRALCEVISESMKKKGEEEHEVVEEKRRIVLPDVTGGEVDVKRVVGKEEGDDGGQGMVEKIKGAVSSLVGGGGGSGGPAAAMEGTGGGVAARESS